MTMDHIEAGWKQMLSSLREQKQLSLQAFLNSAKLETMNGDVLTISFGSGYDRHRQEVEVHRQLLQEILAAKLGQPIRIQCIIRNGQEGAKIPVPPGVQQTSADAVAIPKPGSVSTVSIEEARAELDRIRQEISAEQDRLAALQKTNKSLTAMIEQLEAQAQSAAAEAKKNVVLQQEVKGLETQRSTLQREIQALQAQKPSAERDIQTLQAQKQMLQRETAVLQAQRQALQPEIDALQNRQKKLEEDLTRQERERTTLEKQVAELKTAIEAEEKRWGREEEQLVERQQQIQARIAELERHEREMATHTEIRGQRSDVATAATTPSWLSEVVGERRRSSTK